MSSLSRSKLVRKIIPNIAVTTTPGTQTIGGFDCRIMSISGNTWINPLGTASATVGSYLLPTGKDIELSVLNDLSLVSDVTGSTVQILIYE